MFAKSKTPTKNVFKVWKMRFITIIYINKALYNNSFSAL